MFRNYLITAWRNIIKNGMFSTINIFGLAIGMMSCILISIFVREEIGFDQWLTDSERLVRLHTTYTVPDRPVFSTVRSAGMMMEALRDYARNEIEEGVRLVRWDMNIRRENDVFSETMTWADGTLFKVFDLPFVHGSKESSFANPDDVIITEAMALKYFGRTDVVGESLTACCYGDNTFTYKITGVIRNLPRATHLDFGLIVRINPSVFENISGILDTWTSVNVFTYFKMREGISAQQLQERITYWVDNESPFTKMSGMVQEGAKVSDTAQHTIMSVPDLHLDAREYAGSMGDITPLGDRKMINTFVLVTLLILSIACINFMNLATVRASQRAREVAMRKVLGASRTQVAIQFLGEAVAMVLIALLFALVAVELVLPVYNQMLGRELEFRLFNDPTMLLTLVAVAILVGMGAGLYPAIYLSRYSPSHILSASKGSESNGTSRLRTALVIFQFSTSIILVVCTAVIYGQTLFANAADVGYASNNKLILNIRSANHSAESLKQELLSLAEISSVSFSSEAPTQDNENNNYFTLLERQNQTSTDSKQLLNYHHMGYGFFDAYGVSALSGRLFDESYGSDKITTPADHENTHESSLGRGGAILNISAIKKYGFADAESAIGKTLEVNLFNNGKHHLTIIGVIPDIYFRSIKFGVRPTVYMLNPKRFHAANITFHTDDLPKLIKNIEEVWKRNVPMSPIDLSFLSEMMAAQYENEARQAKLFLTFSLLAIFVACLGLFGLAAFTAERRTKEIGVRKIMGARVRDIVKLFVWQFSKPVILANVIAWPVAIYVMSIWLETFPYHMSTLWLLPICMLAGLLSLIIAWVTVGGNATRVARENPIKALRHT